MPSPQLGICGEQRRTPEGKHHVPNPRTLILNGVAVDLFTASAIVAVFDACNETNKAAMLRLPIYKMARIAFKCIA